MDTTGFRLIPSLLEVTRQADIYLAQLRKRVFDELGIPEEKRGVVEFRYVDRFWSSRPHRSGKGHYLMFKKENNSHEMEDGVAVDDDGTVIGDYLVFRMEDGTVDLVVFNHFLEEKKT